MPIHYQTYSSEHQGCYNHGKHYIIEDLHYEDNIYYLRIHSCDRDSDVIQEYLNKGFEINPDEYRERRGTMVLKKKISIMTKEELEFIEARILMFEMTIN